MSKNITVNLNPNGGQVKIVLNFLGDFYAEYSYGLWSATSNTKVDSKQGNNNNPQEDSFLLPEPLSLNNGRLANFTISFFGKDENHPNYNISAHVLQDGNEIGVASEQGLLTFDDQDLTFRISIVS